MYYRNVGKGKIYAINNNEIERISYFYGNNGNESIKNAKKRLKGYFGKPPDFLFNAELFNFKTRKPASDVVCNGKVHRLTSSYGYSFIEQKKAIFSYNNSSCAKDYIGGYPCILKNNKIYYDTPSGLSGSRGRTAIGNNDTTMFFALIPDGNSDVTLCQLAKEMKSIGARNAINLDGGGSTQYYTPYGNHITGRNLRGFIAIWLKQYNEKPASDTRTVNVKTSLNIRQSPSILSKKVGSLYNGDLVTVCECKNGWCKINTGWVLEKYLKC